MLPYQAVAMDYAGYQRQPTPGHPGSHMASMGSLGMAGVGVGVGASPFTHSWLVPPQDLCAVPYNKMPNQPGGGMHSQQQPIEPGILELRKEKSRDAARSRRGKENYEFYELAKMLPLPAAITSQLDKASIIRLTISYLKLRDFSGHGDPPWTREASSSSKLKSAAIRRSPAVDLFEQHQGTHILQSLDGFALAVAADGRFLYISETVSIYLGLSQVEMTGSSIFDYIHQGDHAEIAEQLGLSLTSSGVSGGGGGGSSNGGNGLGSPTSGASDDGAGTHGTNNPDVAAQMTVASTSGYKGYERSFCIRMKSTLTKRGCHFKSSGYRATNDATANGGKNAKPNNGSNYSVVLLLCKLRPQYTFSHTRKSQPPLLGMVALAIALPPPSVHEIRLECDMFVTRINFDFRIAHCEPRVSDLLDYNPEDLVGKSIYSLCHAEDANRLRKNHMDLIEKGQVLTGYFRLMNKNGGYTWMQSCATVVCSTKNADEQNIICVNYVISNREYENLILDCCQLEPSVDSIKHEELTNIKGPGSPGADPANDTHTGLSGDGKNLSPKTDSDVHHGRGRGRGGANSTAVNTNVSSLALIKDSPTPLGVDVAEVAAVLPTVVGTTPTPTQPANNAAASTTTTTTTTTTKRKRKSKAAQLAEDQQQQQQQQQQTDNNANVTNVDGAQQPLAKVAALDRDTPRGRLPSLVGEEQQQQQQAAQQQHNESSVKDLENAMSKHLPSPGSGSGSGGGGGGGGSGPTTTTTDFSADALLKQQQQQQQHHHHHHQQHHQQQQQQNEKSSTIQWIGAPHYQQPAPMPATALLRQLYANRESVIRATARQTPTGGVFYSGGGGDGQQQNGPLPTPPGSESSYDTQYLQLHSHPAAQKGAGAAAASADAFTNLVSTYGGYHHSTIDYHNAMTPPSSVSPRDSNNAAAVAAAAAAVVASKAPAGATTNGYADATAYVDPLRTVSQYATPTSSDGGGAGGLTPSLPLKPQPYSVAAAAAMHHTAAAAVAVSASSGVAATSDVSGVTYSNLEQPQYFAPHSSFHLYHKGAPSSGWYSTPS